MLAVFDYIYTTAGKGLIRAGQVPLCLGGVLAGLQGFS